MEALTDRLPAVLDPTADVDLAWSSTTQREVLES
jgi:hypothetical protein